LIFHTSVYCR